MAPPTSTLRPPTLLAPDLEAVAQRTAELVLARMSAPVGETIGLDGLQTMLGCRSTSATYRAAAALNIRAYLPGKYRRKDVENAIARRSYAARKTHA